MRLQRGSACLLAAALAAPAAPAAIVHLKDGGAVRGTVVGATARDVTIHTPAGVRTVDAEQVERIDYSDQAPPAPASLSEPRAPGYPFDEAPGRLTHSFSVEIGLAAPVSSLDFRSIGGGQASNGDVGPLVGLRYLHRATTRLETGIDFNYFHRGATDSRGLLASADASVAGDTVLFLALAKYLLIENGPARPYLLAGVGPQRTSTMIDAAPRPGFAWSDTDTDETRRLVDGQSWGLAATARAGLDFEVLEPAVLGVEAGWAGLRGGKAAATSQGGALGLDGAPTSFDAFVLAARWGWRF